jgi:hypothetical protein
MQAKEAAEATTAVTLTMVIMDLVEEPVHFLVSMQVGLRFPLLPMVAEVAKEENLVVIQAPGLLVVLRAVEVQIVLERLEMQAVVEMEVLVELELVLVAELAEHLMVEMDPRTVEVVLEEAIQVVEMGVPVEFLSRMSLKETSLLQLRCLQLLV